MVRIAPYVREIMPEAIEKASDGGAMVFDARSLYYKVREIFTKKYPDRKFYKNYDSFSQDFLPKYQQEHGEISNMVRAPRGSIAAPKFRGMGTPHTYRVDKSQLDEREDYPSFGVGNKVILMEKEGLYTAMVENEFPRLLDTTIMTTKGFSTELGRRILIKAEKEGIPLLCIHDFDVNGVVIKESLENPTKRRNFCAEEVVDLGFDWPDVRELMNDGITAEPVDLKKSDRGKLEGLHNREQIPEEAYRFLQEKRIELNALRPSELLEWMEQKLRDLGYWKTVPEEDELKDYLDEEASSYVRGVRDDLEEEVREEKHVSPILEELGLKELDDALFELKDRVTARLEERFDEDMEDTYEKLDDEEESPGIEADTSKMVNRLEESPEKYWKIVANEMAVKYIRGIRETLDYEEPDADKYAGDIAKNKEICEQLELVKEYVQNFLDGGDSA